MFDAVDSRARTLLNVDRPRFAEMQWPTLERPIEVWLLVDLAAQ
jgi:hypothetical protein